MLARKSVYNLFALLMAALMLFAFTACSSGKEPAQSAPPSESAPVQTTAAVAEPTKAPESSPQPTAEATAEPTAEPTPPVSAEPKPIPSGEPDLRRNPDWVKLDGSTANIPLAVAVYAEYYGITPEEAEEYVKFSRTAQSYYQLVYDASDLLLANIADDETQKNIEGSGVPLEYYPFRTEGLCFVLNENNPVKSLTVEQILGIYTGVYTNWSQLGGFDKEIIAFQRNNNSGSQALMQELVLKGVEPAKAPTERIPTSMGELIDYVSEYSNEANAIGYTTFYYATEMYTKPGLHFAAINGVEAAKENIANKTYPLLSENHIVIRASEAKDSPVRKMLGWLMSEEGYKLIEEAGYVPVKNY